MKHPALHALCVVSMLLSCLRGTASETRELVQDPGFDLGFTFLDPKPGERRPLSSQAGAVQAKAVWDVAQWSSRFPLFSGGSEGGKFLAENAARAVKVSREKGSAALTLTIRGSKEYGDSQRKPDSAWPHLLIEQKLAVPAAISPLASLRLKLKAKLDESVLNVPEGYNPQIHAAQFVLFIHISNLDRTSPMFGRYLHFGVPIYDNRNRFPPAHIAPDTGDTGMFIYMPGLKTFSSTSAQDADGLELDCDILPAIKEGLAEAAKRGALPAIESSDFRVTFLTFGWELPGNLDASLTVSNLSLIATSKE